MSNESRENLQGTDSQDVADLTVATGQAVSEPTAAAVDAAAEGATASSTNETPTQQPQQTQPQAPQPTQGEVVIAPLPGHLPTTEPRPWYRSRRSFAAKGRGGKVLVAGLGLTYTDDATGAVLLADVDMGFRARTLSAILDPSGRRARALFLILAGLEEPHAGRIVAAPSRSWAARLAGRIGSVALIRTDSPLDNALTIRQNILAPLSATGSVADWDNLVGALQVTGLAQRVDLRPSELTRWERFKALIARAIVSGADVFLIEDPVSLPADARAEFEPLLRSLTNAGCAVVVSTASAEFAASTDRAILLTNGRVALDAPGPSQAIIAASLEANPEDPKSMLALLPSSPSAFDEVVAGISTPVTAPAPSTQGPAADETALMAPIGATDAGTGRGEHRRVHARHPHSRQRGLRPDRTGSVRPGCARPQDPLRPARLDRPPGIAPRSSTTSYVAELTSSIRVTASRLSS